MSTSWNFGLLVILLYSSSLLALAELKASSIMSLDSNLISLSISTSSSCDLPVVENLSSSKPPSGWEVNTVSKNWSPFWSMRPVNSAALFL